MLVSMADATTTVFTARGDLPFDVAGLLAWIDARTTATLAGE